MKKVILFYLFLSLLLIGNAQSSVDKGRLQFKIGNSVFLGKSTSSNDFNKNSGNLNGVSKDFSTLQTQFSVHYNTHKNFALGFYIQNGQGSKDSTSYSTTSLGFLAEYYLINKPKFNLFIDVSAGGLDYSGTSTSEIDTLNNSFAGRGSANSVGLGINKYFGNIFGLTLRTGYMRNSATLDSYFQNGIENKFYNLNKIEDIKTFFNGGYVNFGIVIKIRNKSPKSE